MRRTLVTLIGALLIPGLLFFALPILLAGAFTDETTTTTGNASGTGIGHGLSDAVPAEYRDVLLRAGSICDGISPSLLAAQIAQESGWRADATSPAGARGISQFMPATWAQYGQDGNGDGQADILDPHDAIYSQGVYMCQLYESINAMKSVGTVSGDSVELTLAAYNAGLGSVNVYGGIPPYTETQNYVSRITSTQSDYAGASPHATTSDVQEALDWARSIAEDDSHLYVTGGEGPHYDCSGLSQAYMRRRGIELPHRADQQARMGTEVSEQDAQPGDLIFWSRDGGQFYFHVAIYLGDGMMISADNALMGINVEEIYWRDQITFRTYQ